MASRYTRSRIIINNSEYYAPLRESRGDKDIVQYATLRLRNPTAAQRASTLTTTHVWKFGDRFYNLADQYYNDSRYWWVIAWWNSYPTEAAVRKGTVLYVPINLEDALNILGA
jgi:hypothetical protein